MCSSNLQRVTPPVDGVLRPDRVLVTPVHVYLDESVSWRQTTTGYTNLRRVDVELHCMRRPKTITTEKSFSTIQQRQTDVCLDDTWRMRIRMSFMLFTEMPWNIVNKIQTSRRTMICCEVNAIWRELSLGKLYLVHERYPRCKISSGWKETAVTFMFQRYHWGKKQVRVYCSSVAFVPVRPLMAGKTYTDQSHWRRRRQEIMDSIYVCSRSPRSILFTLFITRRGIFFTKLHLL